MSVSQTDGFPSNNHSVNNEPDGMSSKETRSDHRVAGLSLFAPIAQY